MVDKKQKVSNVAVAVVLAIAVVVSVAGAWLVVDGLTSVPKYKIVELPQEGGQVSLSVVERPGTRIVEGNIGLIKG